MVTVAPSAASKVELPQRARYSPSMRTLPRTWMLTAALLGAALTLAAGCGKQQEGERCDTAAQTDGGESDCADGLVCIAINDINTELCCPENGTATDLGCLAGNQGSGGNGTTGSGGAGGGNGGAGGATAGSGGTGGSGTAGAGGA